MDPAISLHLSSAPQSQSKVRQQAAHKGERGVERRGRKRGSLLLVVLAVRLVAFTKRGEKMTGREKRVPQRK